MYLSKQYFEAQTVLCLCFFVGRATGFHGVGRCHARLYCISLFTLAALRISKQLQWSSTARTSLSAESSGRKCKANAALVPEPCLGMNYRNHVINDKPVFLLYGSKCEFTLGTPLFKNDIISAYRVYLHVPQVIRLAHHNYLEKRNI